jgi:hypothetical protein
MMRAGIVFFGLFLTAATEAMAQPPALILPEPSFYQHGAARLSLSDNGTFQDVSPAGGERSLARGTGPADLRPLSIGPFSMGLSSSQVGRDGKRAHYAELHFDDFHPLGGNVSGSFDGRGAVLKLSWPTGH